MAALPTWDFAKQFRWTRPPPVAPSWGAALRLVREARAPLEERLAGFDDVLAASDREFERLGGDPCRHDWRAFRPLRPSREEDWSDWLAWLLETSRTGVLAARMFGGAADAHARPTRVQREWTLPGGYRADLGLCFADAQWVHLEVKVGDLQFAKTRGTGDAMREELGSSARRVRDFVLLPDDHGDAWASEALACSPHLDEVIVVRWSDVAVGLRRAILRHQEPATWEAWAYGFCGVAEQRLLRHPFVPSGVRRAQSLHRLASLDSLLHVVREGMKHG